MVATIKISIYLLCVLTAIACTWLQLRGYWRTHTRLLLWSAVCFGFLALNSFIVLLELLVFPGISLQTLRHVASLIAVGSLLVGLVWETE